MNTTTIDSVKGVISYCTAENNEVISAASDFLDVIMNCPSNTIALDQSFLSKDFFDLKTGIAGDFLQKISNYRKRLIILGKFDTVQSKSLKDFIYESNKTGQIVFASEMEAAVTLLRAVD